MFVLVPRVRETFFPLPDFHDISKDLRVDRLV